MIKDEVKIGAIVGDAAYKVIDMIRLPKDVKDECLTYKNCSNDSAVIILPGPKLKAWLEEHGYDGDVSYIGWWSW